MKKIIGVFVLGAIALDASAQRYTSFGVGLTEACRTKSSPSFSGGDCRDPNLSLRFAAGEEFSDYFSLEGHLETTLDPEFILDLINLRNRSRPQSITFEDPYVQNDRLSITTLGVSALFTLPISHDFRLFAGPSVGGSLVYFAYDRHLNLDGNIDSKSETTFGLNYGWLAGAELKRFSDSTIRLQWQNWLSLDSDIAFKGKFNSNTLSLVFIKPF